MFQTLDAVHLQAEKAVVETFARDFRDGGSQPKAHNVVGGDYFHRSTRHRLVHRLLSGGKRRALVGERKFAYSGEC